MQAGGRVLIVGGGIGGLAAAVALRRVGIEVTVFERSAELREIDAGVSLGSAARTAVTSIGMGGPVEAIGGPPIRWLRFASARGRLLATMPQDSVVVHRRDLLRALARPLEPADALRLDARAVGFEQDRDGVTVRFRDGREERGAVLVGADGIHSVVRGHAGEETPLRYSGFTGWRSMPAFTLASVPEDAAQIVLGRGRRFGIFPSSEGRVYWFASNVAPAGGEDPPAGRRRVLGELFRGWPAPVEELIDAAGEVDIVRNDVYDRPPLTRWGTGRATLLGDAAHVALPTLGQGAGQAIEDAAVLAHYLARAALDDSRAVDAALRAYEARRIRRTTPIVEEAWRISRSYVTTNPLLCGMRNARLRLTPDRVWRRRAARRASYDLLPEEETATLARRPTERTAR